MWNLAYFIMWGLATVLLSYTKQVFWNSIEGIFNKLNSGFHENYLETCFMYAGSVQF